MCEKMRIQILLDFFVAHNTMYLKLGYCTREVYIINYMYVFFRFF
jgi:hypothetical protein